MASDQHDDTPTHTSGTGKGEEIANRDGKEAGRHDKEQTGAGRPAGTSTARDATRINPESEDPILPSSPKLPPA
jgi:hypothetical protein